MELQAPIRQRKSNRGRKFSDEARNQEWIRLFRSGVTTPEIGAQHGVTARSVSRILRAYGIDRSEGGKEAAARLRDEAAKAKRLADYFYSLDCSPVDFDSTAQFKAALHAYRRQSTRAAQRGIGWEMTFGQWWRIWIESGRWEERGRSHAGSAVMSRKGDVGPYSVGNVRITTLADNFTESHAVRGHNVRRQAVHAPSVFFHAFR
jgi:hypothetical protein